MEVCTRLAVCFHGPNCAHEDYRMGSNETRLHGGVARAVWQGGVSGKGCAQGRRRTRLCARCWSAPHSGDPKGGAFQSVRHPVACRDGFACATGAGWRGVTDTLCAVNSRGRVRRRCEGDCALPHTNAGCHTRGRSMDARRGRASTEACAGRADRETAWNTKSRCVSRHRAAHAPQSHRRVHRARAPAPLHAFRPHLRAPHSADARPSLPTQNRTRLHVRCQHRRPLSHASIEAAAVAALRLGFAKVPHDSAPAYS